MKFPKDMPNEETNIQLCILNDPLFMLHLGHNIYLGPSDTIVAQLVLDRSNYLKSIGPDFTIQFDS